MLTIVDAYSAKKALTLCRYAVMLAFDVKVEKEAQAMADNMGVQIFTADIIYHLFDRFTAYMAGLK